ncbi:rod shape-determining protein RodA [Alphaproteobacteria bacterium HT1-32]|nr:rod shape-determining protein RodA [Alphaproteobacteria bacterium HT1-32]
MTLREKIWQINWSLILLILATASVGFAMMYSAANGNFDPWATRQMARFGVGMAIMLFIALLDIRFWLRSAYLAYVVVLVLLIAVEVFGSIGMGAQRWIAVGPIQVQPSELMKIALVLALARYFHGINLEDVNRVTSFIPPIIMILMPTALVLRQPDLGTAMMLAAGGIVLMFLAGVRLWVFIAGGVAALASIPIAWQFLRDYQKQRVLTFLDPETDPLGAGYHILQSKIALGSGGMFGKGFLQGTQSHLSFLPEKQTDFVFTMLAEEFGMIGGLGLLGLYALLLIYGVFIAMRSRSHFGRLLAMGVTVTFFLYVFINIAMVMGLVPVVGVPLPLISYGGTAMLTLLMGFGLLMCVYIHRDVPFGRRGEEET